MREGTLPSSRLTAVRAAFLHVLSVGFEKEVCQRGLGPHDEIIVSNGGTPILILTTGAFTASAPDDLTCWNEATHALHDAIDQSFAEQHRR